MSATYGGGGVPTQDTTIGTDNIEGLAALDRRPLQDLATEQGLIRLPKGDVPSVDYMPTIEILECLPFTGTRRSAISDRYYR